MGSKVTATAALDLFLCVLPPPLDTLEASSFTSPASFVFLTLAAGATLWDVPAFTDLEWGLVLRPSPPAALIARAISVSPMSNSSSLSSSELNDRLVVRLPAFLVLAVAFFLSTFGPETSGS